MARGRINTRAVGLVLIALILVLFLAQPTQRYFAQRAQINALVQQVNASEERVVKAKAELERWNDPAYVKAQARARLHFVMPGETQYIVIDPSSKTQNEI
jgi:cell division protein FtsB